MLRVKSEIGKVLSAVWAPLYILALMLPVLQSRFYYAHAMGAEMETERIKEHVRGHRTESEPGTI